MVTIKTIGYSSLMPNIIEGLKEILKEGDSLLVDVRARPYGLINKQELQKEFPDTYYSELHWGNPTFENKMHFRKGYANVMAKVEKYKFKHVILMCAERNVNDCHRLDVSDKLINTNDERINSESIHLNTPRVKKKVIDILSFF